MKPKKMVKSKTAAKGSGYGQEMMRKHNLKNDPRSGKFTAVNPVKKKLVSLAKMGKKYRVGTRISGVAQTAVGVANLGMDVAFTPMSVGLHSSIGSFIGGMKGLNQGIRSQAALIGLHAGYTARGIRKVVYGKNKRNRRKR